MFEVSRLIISATSPNKMNIQPWLSGCIENFGEAPRRFCLRDRLGYLRLPKPLWLCLDPFDELRTLFRNHRTLLADGKVVWGYIVQANYLLHEEGNDNCPGEIVYSLDEGNGVDHIYLGQLASELFALKGTRPSDPELLRIAEYLTDEEIRVFGLSVPSSISVAHCQLSTTLFVRKHLPKRHLRAPLLPVVVNPKEPYVVMPLPERYWPEDLVEWWSGPPFPYERALEEFSDHDEVRRLRQIFDDARSEKEGHKKRSDFDAAALYRELQAKAARELEPLLEQLWQSAHE